MNKGEAGAQGEVGTRMDGMKRYDTIGCDNRDLDSKADDHYVQIME